MIYIRTKQLSVIFFGMETDMGDMKANAKKHVPCIFIFATIGKNVRKYILLMVSNNILFSVNFLPMVC